MNEILINKLQNLDSFLDTDVHNIVEYNLYSKLKDLVGDIINVEEKKEKMYDYYIDKEQKFFKGFLTNEKECDKKNPFYNTFIILLKDFNHLGKFYNNQLSNNIFDIFKNKEIITFKDLSEKIEKSKNMYRFLIKDNNILNHFMKLENKDKNNYPNYELVINARQIEHVIDYLKQNTGFDLDLKDVSIKHYQLYTGHEISFNYPEKEKKTLKKEKKIDSPGLF